MVESGKNPTQYEIVVSGQVSPERAAWFGDMTLTVRAPGAGQHVSVLTGPVADQASLFGILSRIRDLGLKLISVVAIEPSRNGKRMESNQEASS